MKTLLTAVALALRSGAVSAVSRAPYRAEYEVMRNGKTAARATVTLKNLGDNRWELLSVTRGSSGLASVAGLEITERSTLQRIQNRWQTIDYHYRQKAAWRTRERSLRVDTSTGQVRSRDRKDEYVFDLVAGALDRQSVTLALAEDLLNHNRSELSYAVADRKAMQTQRYRILGEETVDTPAGSQRALRVERVRESDARRETTTWHGLEQQLLPAKVVQHESDGDSIEMRLISLSLDQTATERE
jgi:hypothetical protein